MKITNLRSENNGDRERIAATVSWEDCGRPAQDIYFETNGAFADSLSLNPHAFLVAGTIAAMRFGEERVYMDEEVCPKLREGLITVMSWFRQWYGWYGPESRLVRIEAGTQSGPLFSRTSEREGFFFSGGIDSLATIRANRINYPPEHPGYIKDALLVFGLEVREQESFEHVVGSMSVLAEEAGITLIPVYTNIRSLGPDDDGVFWGDFWPNEYEGAAFSSIAHAFAKRLSAVSINSTFDIPSLMQHGSHPLIDPNYSSSDLKIRHVGSTVSRYEKTKLIAEWAPALEHLRVCNRTAQYRPGMLNCGRCEKCIRTMLALLSLGVLDRASAFPVHDVTEELIQSSIMLTPVSLKFYRELITPLQEIGRHDLVRAIRKKMAEYHHSRRIKILRAGLKEADRKYLNSSLLRFKRSITNKVGG